MFDVRKFILTTIILGFFIFDSYGQKIGKPSVSLNNYIQIEIHNLRMVDVLEKIEIEDLNKEKTYNILCHEDDYYMGENDEGIIFEKKTIKLKQLKEKGGKFKFNVKVISKTNRKLYIKQFNPSVERLEKVIRIKFI
jgi:ATP-dependent RNA circularization protein (DNA/RNA ligase family)